jgi:uncharacterized protein YbjT (DUF2867 family)
MARLITVCGATGGIGGSVARKMLEEGWNVGVVTHFIESAASKALRAAGAELITANFDDVASLKRAIEARFKDPDRLSNLIANKFRP